MKARGLENLIFLGMKWEGKGILDKLWWISLEESESVCIRKPLEQPGSHDFMIQFNKTIWKKKWNKLKKSELVSTLKKNGEWKWIKGVSFKESESVWIGKPLGQPGIPCFQLLTFNYQLWSHF